MANEIQLNNSITSLKTEVTEGTAIAPSAVGDYFQAKDDSVEITGGPELLERNIETSSLSMSTPQVGMKSGAANFATELIGSGTEGAAPDYAVAVLSLLGTSTTIASNNTSRGTSVNTQTKVAIETADIGDYAVGDMVVIKESGEHRVHAITVVDTTGSAEFITLSPGKSSGVFSDGVVVSKSINYKTSDTAASSYTFNRYAGDAVREQVAGCRTTSMSLDNFTTGQIGSLTFAAQGMSRVNTASSAAPNTPSFTTALPAVFLGAKLFNGATEVLVNEISLSVEQPVAQLKATGNSNGVSSQHLAQKRKVTGSFPLYTDSTDVSEFTDHDAGTTFSIVMYAGVPSTTAGELTFGSIIAFYMPTCIRTNVTRGSLDGIGTEVIEFQSTGGVNGTSSELTMSFI